MQTHKKRNKHKEVLCLREIKTIKTQRKSDYCKDTLMAYYKKNPNWDLKMRGEIALELGIPKIKVYKWHWHQLRRDKR